MMSFDPGFDSISDVQCNYMPLPGNFLAEIATRDAFLLAFPRSGSRWLMVLLSDLANAAWGVVEAIDYHELLSERPGISVPGLTLENRRFTIPDAHREAHSSSALLELGRAPIYRSHHLAEVILRSSGPLVYSVRRAVPTLYSYYHFARQRNLVPEDFSLADFCQVQLPLWKDHVSTMLTLRQAAPDRVFFVTYQDAIPFARRQVDLCAAHLGVPVNSGTTDWALGRLDKLLQTINAQSTTRYVRGTNAHIRETFPQEIEDWIEHETQELFAQAQWAEEDCLMLS